MHGDVVAAARVLRELPPNDRPSALKRMVQHAEYADRHRLATGRLHPFWGDGSLMTVALAANPGPEPRLDDTDYCRCLAQVFDCLVALSRVTRARN